MKLTKCIERYTFGEDYANPVSRRLTKGRQCYTVYYWHRRVGFRVSISCTFGSPLLVQNLPEQRRFFILCPPPASSVVYAKQHIL